MPRGTPVTPEKDEIDALFGGPEEDVDTPTASNGHSPIGNKAINPDDDDDNAASDAAYAEIVTALEQPLDESQVKTRLANPREPEGPRNPRLKYIEWQTVARNLNRIFGYGKWSTKMPFPPQYLTDKDGVQIGVQVTMELTVEFGREYWQSANYTNTGYSPIYSRGDAEMATGGATHTALKRCATALGEQFGLSLYDKEEAAETTTPTAAAPAPKTTATKPSTLTGNSFDCQDCGKEVKGYYSAKQQKEYSTQDLYEMSMKQTGGLYCFNCKPKHSNR